MTIHTHIVDKEAHKNFLEEKRKDPYTHQRIEPGDHIVFCAACEVAFLLDSWKAMKEKHCNQTETLKEFPKLKDSHLIINKKENFYQQVANYFSYISKNFLSSYHHFSSQAKLLFCLFFTLFFVGWFIFIPNQEVKSIQELLHYTDGDILRNKGNTLYGEGRVKEAYLAYLLAYDLLAYDHSYTVKDKIRSLKDKINSLGSLIVTSCELGNREKSEKYRKELLSIDPNNKWARDKECSPKPMPHRMQ